MEKKRIALQNSVLSTNQVAELTQLSIPMLQRMRSDGTGPPFVKLGSRRVGYRKSDVEAWLASRVVRSTSEARGNGLDKP